MELGQRFFEQFAPLPLDPTRLDRSVLNQMTDQLLVQIRNPLFAKSLVELDQRGGIGNRIHQPQTAEISPWQSSRTSVSTSS
jgi:hypothetical protein